jgi:hypothetical protein
MKRIHFTIIILFVFAISFTTADDFPQATISNGIIHARIYLPDVKDGYYRASRFDWSGIIPELEYKGHSYFGSWFDKYDPLINDAIMGPVEDFSPVGYDEAKAGDNFLKVGVGMVTKPQEEKYFFGAPYKLTNPGLWKIKKRKARVEFIHTLTDNNYSYKYRKTVELVKGKPEMVLSHALTNTGKLPIETNVYDHNFFVIDKQFTSDALSVIFPYTISGEMREPVDFGNIENNKIIFKRELAKNEHLYYTLQGYDSSTKDYDIKIENHKTGAAVHITSDQPLSRLAFWSAQRTMCPEPYIHISIKPGETFSWTIYYQFYICDTN